jgi:pyridoxamine 5'-phosphate oxidase
MFLNESRREYTKFSLDKQHACDNPFAQFEDWFQSAIKHAVFEHNAMLLSTVSNGRPSSRVVLLKQFDTTGFTFFTNYNSKKALEIDANPNVAITFYWPNIERQIRIEGKAEKTTKEASEAYFSTRPRDSQLAAWASHQSNPIQDRAALDAAMDAIAKEFPNTIPLPEFWGGYKVVPDYFEFWQGRENRYHDRIVYAQEGDNWAMSRISP